MYNSTINDAIQYLIFYNINYIIIILYITTYTQTLVDSHIEQGKILSSLGSLKITPPQPPQLVRYVVVLAKW